MKKIVIYTLRGIAMGCTVFTILNIAFDIAFKGSFHMESWYYTKMAVGAMITGIAFGVPTLVYQSDKLSKGLKVLIHMGIGLVTYLCVGFYVGWIPIEAGAWIVAIAVISVIAVSFMIWTGFYLYYKNEAKKINAKIKEKQGLM